MSHTRHELTPAQRSLKGRYLAGRSWAKTRDRTARTAPARKAMLARFEREARELHPDADDKTIAQAAASLRSAYFTELAYRSSLARSRRTASGAA